MDDTTGEESPAARLERLRRELAAAAVDAEIVAADGNSDTGTALVPASGNLPADTMKAQMAAHRAEIIKAQATLRQAAKDLQEEARRQIAAAEAMLAPLREQVTKMEEGIWTVNLYLGRDEYIEPVATGDPAPIDTPLTVRQTVLYMDEETAALAEEGGIDFSNRDIFVEWLQDPTHRDIVVPEQRCVVAVKPRRHKRAYGNPWESAAKNAENERTWFVIRNGVNVYLLSTDDDFKVGARLVPNRDEFTSLFRKTRTNFSTGMQETYDLEPGSHEWLEAEKAAGARERHYMRIALILQGLLDRTAVLAPVKPGLSLLHPEAYNSGDIILLADTEMALTTAREPFYEWLARLNKDLRPGMRVIGWFGHSGFERDTDTHGGRHSNTRLRPTAAEVPLSNVIHILDGRRDGGLVFKYERYEKRWVGDGWGSGGEFRVPKTRASCVVYPSDKFIIPFDLVTVDEMEAYLAARTERHAYADMMPLLKATIAAKREESAAEAPFRDLIAREIATRHDVPVETVVDGLPSLVDWWKLANNHHRPLVADGTPSGRQTEAKALRMIADEWDRRRRDDENADPEREAAIVAWAREHIPDAMYVGLNRSGKVVAFGAMPRRFPQAATGPNVYVREHTVGASLTGKVTTRDWVLPGNRHTRMRDLYTSDEWATWDRTADRRWYPTDDDLAAMAAEAEERAVVKASTTTYYRVGGEVYRHGTPGRVIATGFRWTTPKEAWSSPKVAVWIHPDAPPFDPSTPVMSHDHPRVDRVEVTFRVDFTDKHHRLREPSDTDRSHVSTDQWRNESFTRSPEPPLELPWVALGAHDRYNNRPGLLTFHEDVLDDVKAAHDACVERRGAAGALKEAAARLFASIEKQWTEQVWTERHTRFMEDYADESLWPDHRKTMRDPVFPYDRWNNRHNADRGLMETLTRLVDARVDVDGLTVAAAATLAVEHGADEWVPGDDIASVVLSSTR